MPSRDQYYLHHFGPAQPELNFRNPVVVEEIKVKSNNDKHQNEIHSNNFK